MGSTTSKIAVLAAATTLWPTIASPQQGGAGTSGGVQVDIGVSTSLKTDSNFSLTPGKSLGRSNISDTQLTFGLSSVTSAYDFSLISSGVLRFADIPGRSVAGFEDPTTRLRFVADSADSRLTLTGSYRSVDREFLDPFQIEQEQQQLGSLVGNGGTLRATNLGLTYDIGLNAPLGFTFDLSHDKNDYSNVASTAIFDTETNRAAVTGRLRFSQVAVGRVQAAQTKYEAADSVLTHRTTTDYVMGVSYDINPVLNLDAQIGHTNVDTTTTSGTSVVSGLTGAFTLTKTLPNGSVFGTLTSNTNQNGRRTTLSVGRGLQFPTGTVNASVGVTQGDIGSASWVASLQYDQQLLADQITLSFDRSASTNTLNQEIVDTRLSAAYNHNINPSSQLNLTLDWGRSEDNSNTGVPTIELTNLQAAYSRDLTADWKMSGGVLLRNRKETGLPSANSTSFFLTLDRNFSFRP